MIACGRTRMVYVAIAYGGGLLIRDSGFALYPAIHSLELAMEWLKTAHLLRGRCLEVGKEFSESELQVASDAWKQ
jgi:hypothetical protein